MTTFTTKNQSRKRYYRALGAAVVLIILVTFIILSIRDRNVSNSSTNNSQRDSRHKYGPIGTEKHRNPFYSDEQVEYEPLIQLPDLQIKGQARTVNGKLVASFLSLPYADPPVADKEFESPQTKQFKNISTLNAFYPPIKCYQSSFVLSITEMKALGEESREDCLYLNIWAPYEDCDDCNKTSTDSKPVMVFIHSGVFQFGGIGSPDLDPSVLVAEKDIIVVTVQYRLGIFGFGSSINQIENEGFYSLGLQDQAKALEWIYQNIAAFGGDPNQITLAGHGAGAMSIGFHLMNADTNKLFKRAILQGIQNIWNIGIYGMNDKSVKHIMDDSNCDEASINDRDVKNCIKQTGVKPIVFLDGQQYLIDTFPIPFVPDYNPLTEEVVKKIESMVPETKFNISLLETVFNEWNIFSPDHEIMIGLNSDDDYLFEKVNKITTKVHFSEENNEEDYDYEESDNEDENENVKPSNNDENENDTETKTEEITTGGEEITTSNDHESEHEHEHENENEDESEENENETTTSATIDVERRRRRRRRRQTEQSNLDKDEIVKLCRLVKMYQIQKARTSVTSNVVLYRIDPKVLVNLLEEVIFAFGAKTNWLQDLDKDTINLWGSFVVNGLNGLQETETMEKYDSKIGSDNAHVNMINIGQMSEDENQSKLSIEMFDWQKQCSM